MRFKKIIDDTAEHYLSRLYALESTIHSCIEISKSFEGIPSPTSKHYFASVLFTTLCTRGVSLLTLAPYNSWSNPKIINWDYSSLAVLARSIMEIRLAFHYLCIDNCSEYEWECRWNLYNLHDCIHRIKLIMNMSPESEDIKVFEYQAKELQERLTSNQYFLTLPDWKKKKILKGDSAYLIPLEEICELTGFDKKTYKWLNIFLSVHVHGLPMSFYRIGEQERGRGIYCEVEEEYSSLILSHCIYFLVCARDEMEILFSSYKIIDNEKKQIQDLPCKNSFFHRIYAGLKYFMKN